MSDGLMYVFVEGDDDVRFFERILVPSLQEKYKAVRLVKYAQKPKKLEWVAKFARSIEAQGGEWVFVADLDTAPCVTAKKEQISERLVRAGLRHAKVAVVVKMIESWYVAGLTEEARKDLGIRARIPGNTVEFGKIEFSNLMPQRFDSRVDFMVEILKRFSTEEAQRRNRSFRYWLKNYDC